MMELRERKRKNPSKMTKLRETKKKISEPKCEPMTAADYNIYRRHHLTRNFREVAEEEDQRIRNNRKVYKERNVDEIFANGFVFAPSEALLLNCILLKKNQNQGRINVFCPVDEVNNPYALHPQDLLVNLGKSGGYFFTTSRPNEIQSDGAVAQPQGQWTFTEMNKVLDQNQQVGVKKVYEYCERDGKGKYKVIEYQLDPTPVVLKTCPWFACQLIYNDDAIASCECAA